MFMETKSIFRVIDRLLLRENTDLLPVLPVVIVWHVYSAARGETVPFVALVRTVPSVGGVGTVPSVACVGSYCVVAGPVPCARHEIRKVRCAI